MPDAGLYSDGKWQAGSAAEFTSTDPSSGDVVWQGAGASAAEVDAACAAARAAFTPWRKLPFARRAAIILRFKTLVEENAGALAELIARETGKVLWETRGEVAAMTGKVDISLKAYDTRTGDTQSDAAFGHARLHHCPHGVMAVLGPYNFPMHLPNGHIVPALIAGNTLVFKPSELTPACGAFMVKLWEQAGLPPGVLNLVQGARETGAALLDNDTLNGVLFTGSAATGTFIHKKFAGRPDVILALEMGGNNPLIAWDVADAPAAANLIIHSAFASSGQRCSCARRLIVPRGDAGDAIVAACAALIETIKVGPWDSQPDPFMGPLVSARAAQGVLDDQERHVRAGAQSICLAQKLDWSDAALSPGLLEMHDAVVPDEETFGPLLQVWRADDFDAAMARANATKYGLSAGLISDDTALWERFTTDIRAGIVNFNRPTTGAASTMPFGGPGLSGNFRPGAFYAADYCAWPMASQIADTPHAITAPGLGHESD